ncbi:hypothetical protein OROMI_017355 [Orobanche minor]
MWKHMLKFPNLIASGREGSMPYNISMPMTIVFKKDNSLIRSIMEGSIYCRMRELTMDTSLHYRSDERIVFLEDNCLVEYDESVPCISFLDLIRDETFARYKAPLDFDSLVGNVILSILNQELVIYDSNSGKLLHMATTCLGVKCLYPVVCSPEE